MTKKGEKTQAELDHMDELLDEALRGTFPSSDPVAISVESGWHLETDKPRRRERRGLAGNRRRE